MFSKVELFKTVRRLAKYASDICKLFNQSIMSKQAGWWNLRAENVMITRVQVFNNRRMDGRFPE